MDSEQIREALINLDRSRERESLLRRQADSLLEGLEIITSAKSTDDMLTQLLGLVIAQLKCDHAFILSPDEGDNLRCIASTSPLFCQKNWVIDKVFQRVLSGNPVMLFNLTRVVAWQQQSAALMEESGSALLISFKGVDQQVLLVCISKKRAYFNKEHLSLMRRMAPISSHALHTLYLNEQLQSEIDEKHRFEEYAAFQSGIAEMSISVLHNIGNAVTGVDGNILKIEHETKALSKLVKILSVSQEWISEMRAENISAEEKDDKLTKLEKILQGSIKMLSSTVLNDGKINHIMSAIQKSNQHIGEIIRMHRGASKYTTKSTYFSLRSIIVDALNLLESALEKQGVAVKVSVTPLSAQGYMNKNSLVQMIVNFIKNSIESIQEQQKSNSNLKGKMTLSAELKGESLLLMIEDNGVGVAAEKLRDIFRFGESSKARGSGFGLHSAANFVQSLDGTIEMKSAGIGQGARVEVRIPQPLNSE